MKTLSIDIETFSSENLTKCGVYRYAEAPDFEVLLFGYSADGAPAVLECPPVARRLGAGVGEPPALQLPPYLDVLPAHVDRVLEAGGLQHRAHDVGLVSSRHSHTSFLARGTF